jgi:PAS domain S-box-containing protein
MDSKNESSDVLTAVLDNIAQAMVVIGPDFRVRAFNQRFINLFQLPAEAFQIGIDFREVLRIWAAETGQDAAMLDRAIRELSMPESFVFEFAQAIHGEERWCQLFHNPLPEGGCVRTFSDITEQRKAEESIRRQKNLLAAVLSNMAQGVVVVDNEQYVVEHNDKYRQIFRIDDEIAVNGTAFDEMIRLWARLTGQTDSVLQHALDRLQLQVPFH